MKSVVCLFCIMYYLCIIFWENFDLNMFFLDEVLWFLYWDNFAKVTYAVLQIKLKQSRLVEYY